MHTLLLAVTLLVLSGCTTYHVMPTSYQDVIEQHTQGSTAKKQDGYIIYEPKLFLLATRTPVEDKPDDNTPSRGGTTPKPPKPLKPGKTAKDGKPSEPAKPARPPEFQIKPIWLPDYTKPYRVTPEVFLAKGDFNFTFKDGWQFTGVDVKLDSTGVITAAADIVKGIVSPAKSLAGPSPEVKPDFYLFSVEFDTDKGYWVKQVCPPIGK